MFFCACVLDGRDDIVGSDRFEVFHCHRTSVGTVLCRNSRITQPLSAFYNVAGKPAVLHDIDPAGAVR